MLALGLDRSGRDAQQPGGFQRMGVRTVGAPALLRAAMAWRRPASAASALSASASSTSRAALAITPGSTACTAVPPPQPHTTVQRARKSGASASSKLRGINSGRAALGAVSPSSLAR